MWYKCNCIGPKGGLVTVGHLEVLGRDLEVVVECFTWRRRSITVAANGWKLSLGYVVTLW